MGRRRGAILMPGATYDRNWWTYLDAASREVREIVGHGIPVASMGTLNSWGNAAVVASMGTLKTQAQGDLFAAGKIHLLGVSAGGTCVLNYAKAHPDHVASIALLIPCVDIRTIYSEDRSGFASAIGAAYGGAPAASDNPLDYAAELDGIPIRCWYSTDDSVTDESAILSFLEDSGGEGVSMGAQSHFWAQPWNGYAAAAWMKSNN